MKKIVVTGGSGRLGSYTIRELQEQGYEVVSADVRHPERALCRTVLVNLENLGEVYGVLQGADAVIHLGAIPAPGAHPNELVFQNNVMSTYHVLEAAAGLGISKAVIASSESSYGRAWALKPFSPQYVPMDEEHPQLPQDCYGLSKVVNEQTAEMFNRRTDMQVVSLRFGWIVTPDVYEGINDINHNPEQRTKTVWSYIDVRDAARACRLSLEAEGLGAVHLNIQADDVFADIKSRELLSSYLPEVTDIREPLEGYESLISNKKAKELLNWQPAHTWRHYVTRV